MRDHYQFPVYKICENFRSPEELRSSVPRASEEADASSTSRLRLVSTDQSEALVVHSPRLASRTHRDKWTTCPTGASAPVDHFSLWRKVGRCGDKSVAVARQDAAQGPIPSSSGLRPLSLAPSARSLLPMKIDESEEDEEGDEDDDFDEDWEDEDED